jgi:hypothetical protein
MTLLNLAAFRATPLEGVPFEFVVVPRFLEPKALERVRVDFPAVADAGLLPLSEIGCGPSFRALVDEIRGPELAAAFSDKFGLDLSALPLMITVRARCRETDGRIHTDSETKVVTALLYLNEEWRADGGRLRLLRGPSDIEDMIAEVPPDGGTLVAFRRSERSFHGHKPFSGERRYVMFNWMRDSRVAARELGRHRLTARLKRAAVWLE